MTALEINDFRISYRVITAHLICYLHSSSYNIWNDLLEKILLQ